MSASVSERQKAFIDAAMLLQYLADTMPPRVGTFEQEPHPRVVGMKYAASLLKKMSEELDED